MARQHKPTKTMQINYLHEKLDEFAIGMKYLMEYMDFYGMTPHYQAWVDALANNKDLPNKLQVSDKIAVRPKIEKDGESVDNNTSTQSDKEGIQES